MKQDIILGDCLEVLRGLPDNSVDSIVTDPPYELGFMGKKWDSTGIAYDVELWRECLRVLKPGGHLLAFSGTRTYHRMAVAIEDAGFEVRDMIEWVYGSGFPKSLNIGKAVDKLQGNEREVVGKKQYSNMNIKGDAGYMVNSGSDRVRLDETKGSSPYEGLGTALKPAHEPICMARKPLSEKNVAENCLKWGTGGINIDGSRVDGQLTYSSGKPSMTKENGWNDNSMTSMPERTVEGRFPANLIHDGSDEVVGLFPNTKSGKATVGTGKGFAENASGIASTGIIASCYADSGSASRFFYKAEFQESDMASRIIYCAKASKSERGQGNNHPTVKPVKLMKYLITLITPKNGIVLEPFGGSGTTAVACVETGHPFIIIEREPEYIEIIKKRVQAHRAEPNLFT